MHSKQSRELARVLATVVLAGMQPVVARAANGTVSTVQALSAPPGWIYVVGVGANGTADPVGEFTVCARGPVTCLPGVTITVDFTRCPDIRIANFQPFPGLFSAGCRKVSAVTGPNGLARFRIVGNAV